MAVKYAEDVLSGVIPACRWVRLACQRHLDDLTRLESEDWPWHFDSAKAAYVCRFIEMLPHIKGRWKTKTITLEPWQIFHLCVIFGWVDKEGFRRYLDVYIEVPRKNAKSTETAAVSLYCMSEEEPGAELYALATKKDQARIVFDVARRMAMKTTGLRRRFGIQVEKHRLHIEDKAVEYRPLSSDEDGLDGLNPHFASLDELHAHKTRAVHDVIDSATGSRRQPLKWRITTAGSNQQGVCYEQREYVIAILTGRERNDRYFGIIYTIDLPSKDADGNVVPGDDWKTEAAWRKANPNYGVSVLPADIAALAKKAAASARSQNNFLTKRLNVWVTASEAYFNMDAWKNRCHRSSVLADFEGEDCWIGLDLSSKSDIATKARIFRKHETDQVNGREVQRVHYYVFCEHYLPESVLDSDQNINTQQYSEWQDRCLTLTPGEAIEYAVIEDGVREDCQRFNVRAVGYDPWNAEQLRQNLEKEGVPMIENRMGCGTMSEPMKTAEVLILAGLLHHNADPALSWMLGNVIAKEDAKANVYPRKEKPEAKIDGAVAMIMALGQAIRQQGDGYADLSCSVIG